MAKQVRRPPGPSDYKDPRAREYFDKDLYDQNALVGSVTFDLPSIAAGSISTITIPVNGALKDKGHTVEFGLPSNWNTSLIPYAYVSNDDQVTIVVRNPTGSPIDQASGLYAVRVRP